MAYLGIKSIIPHRRPKNHERLSKKSQRHSAPPGSLEQFKPPQPQQPPSNRRKSTIHSGGKASKSKIFCKNGIGLIF